MYAFLPKALIILAFFISFALISFIGGQIVTWSTMLSALHPMLGTAFLWLGMAALAAVLLWFVMLYFLRPKALILPANPSDDDIESYAKALVSRLRSSPHMKAYVQRQAAACPKERVVADGDGALQKQENALSSAKQTADILAYLDEQAMKETRRTASRIFLTTAISRNGRLDSLIVLVLLVRLVWRVSHIYNQRPHPRQMAQLYANVASTALAAGALEELGLEAHIHALLTPMLAASPMASVPTLSGVGTMLGTALVDGSANALLALRVGIVTRNMLSPSLPHMPARLNPYSEAAKILGQMSQGLVTKVVKATVQSLGSSVTNTARNAAMTAYSSTKNAAQGVAKATADGVTTAAKATADGVTGAAKATADGVTTAAKATADGVTSAAKATADGVTNAAKATADGVCSAAKVTADSVTSVAKATADGVTSAAKATADGVTTAAKATADGVSNASKTTVQGLSRIRMPKLALPKVTLPKLGLSRRPKEK